MNWLFRLPQIALIINAIFSFGLTYFVLQKRKESGSLPLGLLLLATGIWSLFAGLENSVIDEQHKIFFAQFEYIAIPQVAPFFFLFALYYSNLEYHLTIKKIMLLWIIPLATTIIAITNTHHKLLWSGFTSIPEYNELVFQHGVWFWIFSSYSYLQKFHIVWILIATIIPWLGNAFYLSGLIPIPGFDITPFTFALTGALLRFAIGCCFRIG